MKTVPSWFTFWARFRLDWCLSKELTMTGLDYTLTFLKIEKRNEKSSTTFLLKFKKTMLKNFLNEMNFSEYCKTFKKAPPLKRPKF